MVKRGRKGKSDAWKDLVKVHRRGPKRVRVSRQPRGLNGVKGLTHPDYSKRIQIIDKRNMFEQKLGICVFKSVFGKLGLKEGGEYSMTDKTLTKAARCLKKPLETYTYNDYVAGDRIRELKLTNFVGKCIIMTGDIKNANATLTIEKELTPQQIETKKRVAELFKNTNGLTSHNAPRERKSVCLSSDDDSGWSSCDEE